MGFLDFLKTKTFGRRLSVCTLGALVVFMF